MLLPEPEFQQASERSLVAMSRDFTLETRTAIPGLWSEFWTRKSEFPGQPEPASYGVSYAMQPDGRFSYAVGLSIDPMPEPMPEGTCVVTLSAGRYAVFRQRGPVGEIPMLFDAIFSTWLPNSVEQQRDGAVFERYPDDGGSPDMMSYEIWLPVAG